MEEINYIDSIPDYLINFIKQNEENIKNIIKEEKTNRGEGIIFIKSDLKQNKLDLVFYTFKESKQMLELSDDFLNSVYNEDKTTIIIHDNEYKKKFIVYL